MGEAHERGKPEGQILSIVSRPLMQRCSYLFGGHHTRDGARAARGERREERRSCVMRGSQAALIDRSSLQLQRTERGSAGRHAQASSTAMAAMGQLAESQ